MINCLIYNMLKGMQQLRSSLCNLVYAFAWLSVANGLFAQSTVNQANFADELKMEWAILLSDVPDSVRIAASGRFAGLLETRFRDEASYIFRPGSDFRLSFLAPADSSFFIYTWSVPLSGGSYFYDGFLVGRGKPGRSVYRFQNRAGSIMNPEMLRLSADNWYGGVYYSLNHHTYQKTSFYLLLGWDGGDHMVKRRFIDILWFDAAGAPVFGKQIFSDSRKFRVIFTHNRQAYFSLKYEPEVFVKRGWPGKWFGLRKKTSMIVFGRLVNEPGLGNVPVGNIHDAYLPEEGRLKFRRDVDVRNPVSPADTRKRISPPAGLFPEP